jgi:enamine deaminase RidA (YjgF/YER057c/UK114 family)
MKRQLVSSGSPYESVVGFSRAVRVGNIIALGGTAPIGADGKTAAPGDAAGQTKRCFEIIQTALEKAGAGLKDVVRTRIMLKRIQDWEAVASVHGRYFKDIRPASTIVQVAGFIDPEWLVEIEADAVINAQTDKNLRTYNQE